MSRPTCQQCLRPKSRCWCHCVSVCHSPIKLHILQHPDETGHPKNTGLLLARCVGNATLRIVQHLETELTSLASSLGPNPALLFVDKGDQSVPATTAPSDLIVLDATWRKARGWVLSSPWLAALPRVSLSDLSAAPNEVRSSSVAGARSTFVASIEALASFTALDIPIADALKPYRCWQQLIINDQPPRQ